MFYETYFCIAEILMGTSENSSKFHKKKYNVWTNYLIAFKHVKSMSDDYAEECKW
jgi:hypothetical protein